MFSSYSYHLIPTISVHLKAVQFTSLEAIQFISLEAVQLTSLEAVHFNNLTSEVFLITQRVIGEGITTLCSTVQQVLIQ